MALRLATGYSYTYSSAAELDGRTFLLLTVRSTQQKLSNLHIAIIKRGSQIILNSVVTYGYTAETKFSPGIGRGNPSFYFFFCLARFLGTSFRQPQPRIAFNFPFGSYHIYLMVVMAVA